MGKLEEFSNNEWKQIKADLENVLQKLKNAIQNDPSLIIIDNAELMKIFKISSRTAQRWRDLNLIGYSKISGNIFYTMQDVMNLYQEYYEQPRSKVNQLINKRK
ncbi:helix-turn-helix domain-containing protein [Mesonia aestuariivivens]|uniref:Helix-turn-helix domain-containing protein n=1 Tax=Mesonia aestuariivivens TaxID=2796128 RepID=A0ABS6VYS5_9FLAO|nr:helix-turn-helix domain-containing protein [Mesonia aestuariivivens]MBW2960416.1 helix-turn-helix domain-containing protein [Mesonia aestuariivivens]